MTDLNWIVLWEEFNSPLKYQIRIISVSELRLCQTILDIARQSAKGKAAIPTSLCGLSVSSSLFQLLVLLSERLAYYRGVYVQVGRGRRK